MISGVVMLWQKKSCTLLALEGPSNIHGRNYKYRIHKATPGVYDIVYRHHHMHFHSFLFLQCRSWIPLEEMDDSDKAEYYRKYCKNYERNQH